MNAILGTFGKDAVEDMAKSLTEAAASVDG